MYEHKDLDNIITPVDVEKFEQLLVEAKYDPKETQYLMDGFTNGFSLEYTGERKVRKEAPNLKIRIGSHRELWNKVMLEVQKGRYAGPFEHPPFEHYIQSPIDLVPKDKGKKTRLIFHLSYPRSGKSVNSEIPKDPAFDEAIRIGILAGKACHMGKSDMSSAFRHVPMKKSDWALLLMKATNPIDKKVYYFVDKYIPFGTIFQSFSNAVAHLVKYRTKKPLVNYLDHYFLLHCYEMNSWRPS